jgi:signal peptidase II
LRSAANAFRTPAASPGLPLDHTAPLGHIVRFLGVAVIAAVADLATKQWAVEQLGDRAVLLGERFALMLVINTGAAGGVSLGEHTWLINVVGTLATILLVAAVVLPLARLTRLSAVTMGLIAGGAAGNLLSLLSAFRGVPDFLALRLESSAIVFNVADVALWLGALLLLPIAVRIWNLSRRERAMAVEADARLRTVRRLRLQALTGATR